MLIKVEFSKEFRQLVPIIFGALITMSFGMMLAWPSLAYPFLLNDDLTPIPITLDATALIAGFLLEGNTIGSLFSTSKLIPSKIAISFCCALQIVGWMLMFYSRDIFWFLASRASVGFANGCGIGQLRRYVRETCETDFATSITTYLPLGMNVGLIAMCIMGALVDFRTMALYSVSVPVVALIFFTLIPKYQKPETETRINNVLSVKEKNDITKDMTPLPLHEDESKQVGVFQALKCRESRNTLFLMFLLIFIQQYSGGPANIVYSQIIFISSRNPYPKLCSVIYVSAFFIFMLLAIKHAKNIRRKPNLLVSTAVCILAYSLLSLYFFLRHELLEINPLFAWAPLFLLILFNFFHTFSYGILPILLISERLPKYSENIGNKFWIIHFSMSAVISTKIFQVLYGLFGMWIGYLFFICVLLAGFIIISFLPDFTPEEKKEFVATAVTVEGGNVNPAYEITEHSEKN